MGIVEFLTARLDEDERYAKLAAEAGRRSDPRYTWTVEEWHSDNPAAVPAAAYVNDEHEIGVAVVNGSYAADHIARHDPTRVLREVAAKRKLLAEAAGMREVAADTEAWFLLDMTDSIERNLAAPYADHPDYNPAWRIDAAR